MNLKIQKKSFGMFTKDKRSEHNESEDSERSFGLFTRDEPEREQKVEKLVNNPKVGNKTKRK